MNSRASDASSPATQSSSVDHSPSRHADSSVTNIDKGTLDITANGKLPDKKPQSLPSPGAYNVRYDAESPSKASDSTSSSPDRMVSFFIYTHVLHTYDVMIRKIGERKTELKRVFKLLGLLRLSKKALMRSDDSSHTELLTGRTMPSRAIHIEHMRSARLRRHTLYQEKYLLTSHDSVSLELHITD